MLRLLNRNLYNFSTKRAEIEIKSVEGNKPPSYEDTVQGKYAGVLFSVASQSENLHNVLQDMKFFKDLYAQSDAFKLFLQNIQLSREQQQSVFNSFGKEQFSEVTQNFLSTLLENKRVQFLPKIADKYIDYYRILNKEENITIISSKELNEAERGQVNDSLKRLHPNTQFTVQYQVDESILGGLQMYSGNKFLDCSLLSRVQKIKGELLRLSV